MIFWICAATVLAVLVQYCRQVYSRFSRHGVKNMTPLPLLGNSARVLLQIDSLIDEIDRLYNTFPEERFVGKFDFTMPMVIVRDLDLIKRITIKDFDYFADHRAFITKETDPLFGRILFLLKGQEWKDMRSTLSPAFTSSKIRLMVPLMMEVGEKMIKALNNDIQASETDHIDIDVKELMSRYANDVIASCAYGLKIDSHADEHNQFFTKGKEATNFKFRHVLVFLGVTVFPKLMNILKASMFSEDTRHFFKSLVVNTMKDREDRHIVRHDMIHQFMEAKKGRLTHDDKQTADADAGFATVEESAVGKKEVNRVWTDDDLAAQALLFFIAGFEGIASVMSFLMHELAVNPDVQEKLVQEIRENDAKNGGRFDYRSIQEMTYLDMVISELLRLWPASIALDRVCTQDYNLGKPNANATQDYIIRAGENLGIPVWAIHRDPEYFPDPLRFDPERFSEQNKHNIKPFSYLPFGLGPRNCIGSRFALCEMKVMAYQMLQSMKVSPAAKTQIPAVLTKESFKLRIKGGHWVRIKPRN